MKFVSPVGVERFGMRELAAEFHSFDDDAHVGWDGKIIRTNGGWLQRVGRLQRNRAPAFGSDQRRTKTKAVLFARSEAVVHVIRRAEEKLQVWHTWSGPRTQENSRL